MSIMGNNQTKKSDYTMGFTVIELLICLAIMATMAAIAIPNYMFYIPKARVNGVTRMVMADLMAARMKAVNQNTTTKVFFDYDKPTEYKICDDADGDGIVAEGEGDVVVRNIQSEYPNVKLAWISDPTFLPRGTIINDMSYPWNYVAAYCQRYNNGVSIYLSGRMKIEYISDFLEYF